MKRINDLQELSRLITAQWKRGVVTNAAFSAEAFRKEIEAGTLYAQELSSALVLLRRREGFDRLNFYLQPEGNLAGWEPEQTTVLEIPSRPQDAALRASESLWEKSGFTLQFRRKRIVLKEDANLKTVDCRVPVRPALVQDQKQIERIMYQAYDPLTACLPTKEELAEDITKGDVLCAEEDGRIMGFIHLSCTRRATECRHLAVLPEARGRGIALSLLAADCRRARTPQYLLWVAENNLPALQLYEKAGYVPDGWSSSVWVLRKERNGTV